MTEATRLCLLLFVFIVFVTVTFSSIKNLRRTIGENKSTAGSRTPRPSLATPGVEPARAARASLRGLLEKQSQAPPRPPESKAKL